jgi:hypothetical protein
MMKTKSQSIETRVSLSLRVLCLPAIIVGLSVAAAAQEVAKSVETGLTATNAEFVQHWNQQEPAAIAALFTSESLFVAPAGIYIGQVGVQKYYEGIFSTIHPSSDFAHDIDHAQMLSDHLANGHRALESVSARGERVLERNL